MCSRSMFYAVLHNLMTAQKHGPLSLQTAERLVGLHLQGGPKDETSVDRPTDTTVQDKIKLNFTKILTEFARIKIGFNFYAVVEFSL